MNRANRDEFIDLIAAYALDAVSDVERRRIERHLESCASCRAELSELASPAGDLAFVPDEVEPSPELVASILGATDARSAPAAPQAPGRTSIPTERRAGRALLAAAAAVLIAVGFVGLRDVRDSGFERQVRSVVASAETTIALDPQGSFTGSGSVHVSGSRAAIVLSDVPDPGDGLTYQVWSLDSGQPVSVAVLDSSRRSAVTTVDDRWRAFAVTIEPDGGSKAPTSAPVLSA